MQEKVIGYCLLGVGIIIMLFSVLQVYLLFTNRITPYQVFAPSTQSSQPSTVSPQDLLTNSSALTAMQTEIINNVLEKQMSRTLNTAATTFMMYFLMMLGFRLSSLGVMLMRPVMVNVRAKGQPVEGVPANEEKTPQAS